MKQTFEAIIIFISVFLYTSCKSQSDNCEIKHYTINNSNFKIDTISYEIEDSIIKFSFNNYLSDSKWYLNFRIKDSISGNYKYFKPTAYKYENGGIKIENPSFYYFKDNLLIEEFFIWSDENWFISNCQFVRFKFIMKNKELIKLNNPYHSNLIQFEFGRYSKNSNCNLENSKELIEMIINELSCQ